MAAFLLLQQVLNASRQSNEDYERERRAAINVLYPIDPIAGRVLPRCDCSEPEELHYYINLDVSQCGKCGGIVV